MQIDQRFLGAGKKGRHLEGYDNLVARGDRAAAAPVGPGSLPLLVFLSGGLDSTTALYLALTETQRPIVCVHIDFRTESGRCIEETRAVARIVPWLRMHVRDFEFHATRQDYPTELFQPIDLHLATFLAAQFVRRRAYAAVVSPALGTTR